MQGMNKDNEIIPLDPSHSHSLSPLSFSLVHLIHNALGPDIPPSRSIAFKHSMHCLHRLTSLFIFFFPASCQRFSSFLFATTNEICSAQQKKWTTMVHVHLSLGALIYSSHKSGLPVVPIVVCPLLYVHCWVPFSSCLDLSILSIY